MPADFRCMKWCKWVLASFRSFTFMGFLKCALGYASLMLARITKILRNKLFLKLSLKNMEHRGIRM